MDQTPQSQLVDLVSGSLVALQSGHPDDACRLALRAAKRHGGSAIALSTASNVHLAAGQPEKALLLFDKWLCLEPASFDAHHGRGLASFELAQRNLAVASFTAALQLLPTDPEALHNRGSAFLKLGEVNAAIADFRASIAIRPAYSSAHYNLALALQCLGPIREAYGHASIAAKLAPSDAEKLLLCGDLQRRRGMSTEALDYYDRAFAASRDPRAQKGRAGALQELGRTNEALQIADELLRDTPNCADLLLFRANLLQDLGLRDQAISAFAALNAHHPVVSRPSRGKPMSCRALFVYCPTGGNTPIDDVIFESGIDAAFVTFLPGCDYDPSRLRQHGDVVVNLVSDADTSASILPAVTSLVDSLGLPVINAPALIANTARSDLSRMAAGIAHSRVPATERLDARGPGLANWDAALGDLNYPIICREAGTHGGEHMELLDDRAGVARFMREMNSEAYYVTEFVDYRSGDGYWRKYRLMFVDGEILPYHLAIGTHWKVHHASTAMAEHGWMQEEEARFLSVPRQVFGEPAWSALSGIATRFGLDYFGIDCALSGEGNLIVFEVNASMLVHERNEVFPYKALAVARIKAAFATMLERRSGKRKLGHRGKS